MKIIKNYKKCDKIYTTYKYKKIFIYLTKLILI